MNINRFDINFFVNYTSFLPQSTREKKFHQKIEDPSFSNLALQCISQMQSFFNSDNSFFNSDNSLKNFYKNRPVSMLFLDKISKLLGSSDPDVKLIEEFSGGHRSFSSIELMRYLIQVRNHAGLSSETKSVLDSWIIAESEYLPLCVVRDWLQITRAALEKYPSNPLKIPEDGLSLYTSAIASHIQSLQPGESFKVPAGSREHGTILRLQKNADGSFDILHFNTGEGVLFIGGAPSTACRYASVSGKILETQAFWEKFVDATTKSGMDNINTLLNDLNHPTALDPLLQKPLQMAGSCSFHSEEAEFKYSFISEFDSAEKGWAEYKKCTSLMASIATEYETKGSSAIHWKLASMLKMKDIIRQRYLHWSEAIKDPSQFTKIKNSYIDAIVYASPGTNLRERIEGKIASYSPLRALSYLDKCLDERLKNSTYSELIDIREKFGTPCTFEGTNYLGLRELMPIENTRKLLNETESDSTKKEWAEYYELANAEFESTLKMKDIAYQRSPLLLGTTKDPSYIHWLSIKDPTQFTTIKNSYIEAIASLGELSIEDMEKEIVDYTPLQALRFLDRFLDENLKKSSYSQLMEVRNKFGGPCTFEGINYLGLRELMWIKNTRELLSQVASSREPQVVSPRGPKGWIISKISEIGTAILSSNLNEKLQQKIRPSLADQEFDEWFLSITSELGNDILPSDLNEILQQHIKRPPLINSLTNQELYDLWSEYHSREDPEIVEELSKTICLLKPELMESLIKSLAEKDGKYALELTEKIQNEQIRDRALSDLVRIIGKTNLVLAREAMRKIKDTILKNEAQADIESKFK